MEMFAYHCLLRIEITTTKKRKPNGKNEIESLILLFYRYHTIKHVLNEVKHIFDIIFEKNIDD